MYMTKHIICNILYPINVQITRIMRNCALETKSLMLSQPVVM